jgi:predicted esterase
MEENEPRVTRRHLLAWGLGGAATIAAAGVAGFELVDRGVLPGKQTLDSAIGACDVPSPKVTFGPLGPVVTGRFDSKARNQPVGYAIGYPHGYGPGSALPFVVMLHGFGGDHTDALAGISNQQAVAMNVGGQSLPPMALVTVDGGGGYWTPRPGNDPQAMVTDELIPHCRSLGLGHPPHGIGIMGISMGGVGALCFAEKFPDLFAAVAAISPAIWTTYSEAHAANAGAYASPTAFAVNDVVTHATGLHGVPVRVAAGVDDPFSPGVEALVNVLSHRAVVDLSVGCHTGEFFASQQPPSLSFLGRHLSAG